MDPNWAGPTMLDMQERKNQHPARHIPQLKNLSPGSTVTRAYRVEFTTLDRDIVST